MNEIINTLLLGEDKFMSEMHLRQPIFTYSACGQFTKNKERMKTFKEASKSRHIYQNKLDKVCFQHDMAYRHFKDLPRKTVADKILRNKAFNITKNPKYDGYQRGLASMVYNFFDKKTSGGDVKSGIIPNQQLAEELHKPIIREFEKQKVY